MTDFNNYSEEQALFVEYCGDPSDPECQVRVVVRQPALILNQSEIPIQEVSEFSAFANTASLALYAVTASYVTADVLLGDLPNVWYVSELGDDVLNNGKTLEKAYRTVKKAAEQAKLYIESSSNIPKPRATIIVATGYYEEEAPIVIPPFTSIIGNDLRTAVIRPTYATRNENLFLMNNGTYAYGLRLEGCEIDDLNNPRSGFFFAFDPGAYIVTSPYIQNCTSAHTPASKFYVPLDYQGTPQPNPEVGNGPGGMIVDDSVLDGYSPLKSMIVDAYTQVAFNGMGLVVRGEGYAQQVSFFTNFSHVGVWAIDGGHASLLNSNTTFGDYGLRSTGKRILVVVDADEIPTGSDASASALIAAEKQNIISNMMQRLQLSGSYSASYFDSSSAIYQSTIKDSGILVDSIVSDLLGKPGRIVNFTQGLFKAQDVSNDQRYTLPTASGYDKGVITSFRVNDIFRYSEASCSRDVGYIVDAVATDLLYGGNQQSINAGVAYYLYPSVVTTTQLEKTLEAIQFVGNLVVSLTTSSIESASIATNISTILDIVENGTGSLPLIVSNSLAPASESLETYTLLMNEKSGIQSRTIDFVNDALIYDFLRSWKYVREYILDDPENKFGALSLGAKTKIGQLLDVPINTVRSVVINLEPTLLQEFGALITSTSHDFSYAGSGVNFLGLPANQRGLGETNFDIRVVETGGGRVYTSFGDETGDFFVGLDFIIRQATGTIEGRTFNKATAARFTPLILALT